MAGRDLKDDGAADLHKDENWQARLEEARVRRAKALREKERLSKASGEEPSSEEPRERLKPWQVEAAAAKPISPIIQEKDLNRDDLDFADRVDAIRHTAQNAPEPDNDAPEQDIDTIEPPGLDEEAFLQEAAATLSLTTGDSATVEETPDPNEVLVLSERYAAALDAFTSPKDSEVADAETAARFAASLAAAQQVPSDDVADVVVDLADRYVAPEADIEVYPGADPELAKRYADALAAFSGPHKEQLPESGQNIAASGRRIFMLTSLVVVVGFLTLPMIPVQPVESGPEVVSAPATGLQPALGPRQSLQETFAMTVPLLPRVSPAAPNLLLFANPAKIVPTPASLSIPGEVSTPDTKGWAEVPVQRSRQLAVLHDPLSADRTLVAGLSPFLAAPTDAVIPPERFVRKLPQFSNVRTEVRPSLLDGNNVSPISGSIVVTALDTDDTFDALAAAIAEDVARSLRR